jgi:hypothetical protein
MALPGMRRTLRKMLAGTLAILLLPGPESLPGSEQQVAMLDAGWA